MKHVVAITQIRHGDIIKVPSAHFEVRVVSKRLQPLASSIDIA
jgi:hypothetical protein